MFDRSLVKKEALSHLRHNWKYPFLVAFITGFLSVCFNAKDIISSLFSFELTTPSFTTLIWFFMSPVLSIVETYFFLAFVKSREETNFYTYLEGFNLWIKGITSFLYILLKTLLWALLLIIPGIIKLLCYSMTSWIIAEYPSISVRKAVRVSCLITKGYLFDLFLFYFSFIGWLLLTALTGGILSLWVQPYIHTASTYVYLFLKETALDSGTITREDIEG